MNEKAILVVTSDQKKYLTSVKNLESLLEFAKTFKAQIYEAEVVEGKPSSLKTLVASFCNQEYEPEFSVEPGHRLYPPEAKNRKAILSDAKNIRQYIEKQIMTKKSLSMKELKSKFQNVTDACLCNHFSAIRREMSREGYSFKKIGAGHYSLCQ